MAKELLVGKNGNKKTTDFFTWLNGLKYRVIEGYTWKNGLCYQFYGAGGGGVVKWLSYADNMSSPHFNFFSGIAGNYAVFAGGGAGGTTGVVNIVEVYNSSLTRSNPVTLSTRRGSEHGNSTLGNNDYVLFGGGTDSSSNRLASVEAISSTLTMTTLASTFRAGRRFIGVAGNNGYLLYAGGEPRSGRSSEVDAINTSLTMTYITDLQIAKSQVEGTCIGNYILFGGGSLSSGRTNTVDAYDSSLTHSTVTGLQEAKSNFTATTNGAYALFGGGYVALSGKTYTETVDSYNSSLTHGVATDLSVARQTLTSAKLGDYAMFIGGYPYQSAGTIVDTYNTSLTRGVPDSNLKVNRGQSPASVTLGDKTLVAGGYTTSAINSVEVYTIA